MVITTTAVSFILLSLGLAFCGWRFFRALRQGDGSRHYDRTRFLISLSFAAFAVQNGVLGFGMLFFAENPLGLFWMLVVAAVILTFAALISVYTVYNLFFPQRSPLLAISFVVIVGVINTATIFIDQPRPFMTPEKGIDWNLPTPISLATLSLLLMGIWGQFYIFNRLFLMSQNREIKILSLLLSSAALIAIVDVFIRFALLRNVESGDVARTLDVGIALVGLIYVVSVLLPNFFGRHEDSIMK